MKFENDLRLIKGFEQYSVDIYGRVYNASGRELKQTINQHGYLMVKLCNQGYEKNCQVHRLVANAFYEGNHSGLVVNHIDGNKQNNRLDNLEWVTPGENQRHAYAHNLRKSYLTDSDRRKGSKISGERSSKPVRVLETGRVYESARECARQLNCSQSAIGKCCRGLASQHHGMHFTYETKEVYE